MGDPRILDALKELSVVAVQGVENAAAEASKPVRPKQSVKELFHQLATSFLAPANMLSQMTMAVIILNPGPLMRDPAFEEGVKFFVYTTWGYIIPGAVLVLFHSERISRETWLTILWVVGSVVGIAGLLSWFDR